MLEQKADRRPAVCDLLAHEQVQVRILEKKYKDKYAYLKKKEQEIAKREKSLQEMAGGAGYDPTSRRSVDSETAPTDKELLELEEVERKLVEEIERAERETTEIEKCMKQNDQVMQELRDQISCLRTELDAEENEQLRSA